MKKVLESSAKITIRVMLGLALLGIALFLKDTWGDVLGSITSFDDQAAQTTIWLVVTLGIALGIKLYPGSYRTIDENGKVVSEPQ